MWATQDGDEWGDLRRIVDFVDVAAFGGVLARYDFIYADLEVGRDCPHDYDFFPPQTDTITTKALTSISVPESQPYLFETGGEAVGGCGNGLQGRVTKVTLPTRGYVEYAYGRSWEMPTRCNYAPNADNSVETFTLEMGISTKKRFDETGSIDGTWEYDTDLFPPASQLVAARSNCTRANYRKTTVDRPFNIDGKRTQTVTYHSVAAGPQRPLGNESGVGWQVTDHGLPYSKDFFINGGGLDRLFLSSQTFQCDGSCDLKRSTYRRYVSEYRSCFKANGDGDTASCFQINPMQLAERTIFHDDGGNFVETRGSDLDGAGHFRTQTTTDSFAGTSTRSTTTQYNATGDTSLAISTSTGYINPGLPSNYLPAFWVLTPYSKVTSIGDGRTYVTESAFDRGVQVCSRTWKNSAQPGVKDRVVTMGLGATVGVNAGLPISEVVSGGEFANLGTGSACTAGSAGANGRRYDFDHTYLDLQLAKTQIAGFPNRYHADIDQNTGLPSRVYNASDEGESLSFDKLGRLTQILPDATRNEAVTDYSYSNTAGAAPSMTMTRSTSSGGTALFQETMIYDHLGRLEREVRRNPSGLSGFELSDQQTTYDAAGNPWRKTTRQLNDGNLSVTKSWRSSDYDAFGRAGTITAPDVQSIQREYFGVRADKSKVNVQTPTGLQERETTTVRDVLGRTTSVTTSEHQTQYTYDPNGRMVQAKRFTGLGQQERNYTYDARGYLLFASIPEVTGNGGGISFKPDAIGLSWEQNDGLHALEWVYDGDGRPTILRDGGDGSRLWKTWTYGINNSDTNKQKGRLIEAARYNYPPSGENVAIVETYEHKEGTAGASQIKRQIQWIERLANARFGATFRSNMTYDKLGNPTNTTFPTCVVNTVSQGSQMPCADGDDVTGPSHTASWRYNQGLLRRAFSSLGPDVEYKYHPNLQMQEAVYSNGVTGTYSQGTNGLVRPAQRTFTDPGNAILFDTGPYQYDAAGNITEIGADKYTYDGASRLRESTVKAAGSNRFANYTYDTADNMTSVTSDLLGARTYNIDLATNRLLGVGAEVNDWAYDTAGNVKTALGGAFQFDWDSLNMQSRFSSPEGEWISIYGPGDYRVWVEDTSTGVRYWTSRGPAGQILSEYEIRGSGTAWTHIRDFLHGAEGLVATRNHNGTSRFFHSDHLGTPRLLTASTGRELSQHHYYPFGLEAKTSLAGQIFADGFETGDLTAWREDRDELSFKYTGHQREPHEDADYMKGRYYLNVVHRFASVDPARDGWNLYGYGASNPMKFVDPSGRSVSLATDKKTMKKVKPILVEALRRPSGRASIQEIDESSIDFTYQAGELNSLRDVVRVRRGEGDAALTFGAMKNATFEGGGTGTLVAADLVIDTAAVSVHPSDTSGIATLAHETDHALRAAAAANEGLPANEVWSAAVAGDRPTSASGPSRAFGQLVFEEAPDLTIEQAEELLERILE